MNLHRFILLACAGWLLSARAGAEDNLWPVAVQRDLASGTTEQYLGPLFFVHDAPGVHEEGFRPFFHTTVTGDAAEGSWLYPFVTWRRGPGYRSFSFFQLVNRREEAGAGRAADQRFDVWPFYFSRRAADPADSYRAFFPFGGTIRHRFGQDRVQFTLFPFYVRTEDDGRQTSGTPWPFVRHTQGGGHEGFALWPLFGYRRRAGDYDQSFVLWPLGYRARSDLSAPVPTDRLGVLPFYARDTGPGFRSETWAWPFFGYTHRTAPYHYDEHRYLWPLLVQARGEARYVNRWAPLYTHSVIKGYDKTWLLWPAFRHATWTDAGLVQEKNQFLFFVYWSLEQRSAARPDAEPARKTHLWPLVSAWENGAGRRQLQALSPFEVFFPNNATVRKLWTPLFALYRYDRQSDTTSRHALLWDAITFRRAPGEREFHLGPLLSLETAGSSGRFALGCGLAGFRRTAGGGWRPFLFDFRMKADKQAPPASSP